MEFGNSLKDMRRKEAQERQEQYKLLSLEQRLAKLNKNGYRALRERARIQKSLSKV